MVFGMIITIKDFSGMLPILAPYRLPNNMAQFAENCKFVNGDLSSFNQRRGPVSYVPYGSKSVYRHVNGTWIASTTPFNICPSTIINDTNHRLYKTQDGVTPQTTYSGTSTWYTLGIPKPVHAPTIEEQAVSKSGSIVKILSRTEYDVDPNQSCYDGSCATTGSGPLVVKTSSPHDLKTNDRVKIHMHIGLTFLDGQIYPIIKINDTHFSLTGTAPVEGYAYDSSGSWELYRDEDEKELRGYCYTFVSRAGEEGVPSPIQTEDIYPDSTVKLTNLSGNTYSGRFDLVLKRIYRSVTSSTGTRMHFVGDIPYYSTEFVDNIDPEEVGEPLPSESWDMPHPQMRGLTMMPNGILAGFVGRDICFSDAYMPHAWPVEYRINVEYDIVAMAVFGQSMVIGTTGKPYIVTGTDPASMTLEKTEINQACVSRFGMVDMGETIIYPSPDGLIEISRNSVSNITKSIFSRKQWEALNPSSLIGASYEGKYLFCSGGETYILDKVAPTLTTIDGVTTAGYTDILEDQLYIVQGSGLYAFDDSLQPARYVWKSKRFRMPRPVSMSCIQVVIERDATSGSDVLVSVYADGSLIMDKASVMHRETILRLPGLNGNHPFPAVSALDYEIEVEGVIPIISISMATDIADLRNNV